MVEAEQEARLEVQRMSFGERSDGPGKQVTTIRQSIEKAVAKRDRLAADVRAMESLFEEPAAEAEAAAEARALAEA